MSAPSVLPLLFLVLESVTCVGAVLWDTSTSVPCFRVCDLLLWDLLYVGDLLGQV